MLTLDNIDLIKKYPTDAQNIEAMRDWIFQFYIEVEFRLNMLQRQIEKYHADDVFKNGTDVEYGDPVIDVAPPAYIEILQNPVHMVYSDGDQIDISGIVVRAYKANGLVWVDENHPNGYIPETELTFSPTDVHVEGDDDAWTDGNGVNVGRYTMNERAAAWGYVFRVLPEGNYGYDGDDPIFRLGMGNGDIPVDVFITEYENKIYMAMASGNGVVGSIRYFTQSNNYSEGAWIYGTSWSAGFGGKNTTFPKSTKDPSSVSPSDLHPPTKEITVSWERPNDKKKLTDTYEISIE